MKFLSLPELKAWYMAGLDAFGYRSLEPEVLGLYARLVEQGATALPAGLLARWYERLLARPAGEQLPGVGGWEHLLAPLCQGTGFERLCGQYGLRPPTTAELQQLAGLVFGRLDLRHQALHFDARTLGQLGGVEPDPAFAASPILDEILTRLGEALSLNPVVLDGGDLFTLAHPDLFEQPGARELFRRLRACAAGISAWCDTHLQLEEDGPEVVSRYGQPEALPLGGYDELGTRGDLAALLPSELALIDPSEPIDYFDYKYLHGELLYFQREQGQVFRIRRQLHIELPLSPGLEHARHLAPLLAFVLVLIQSLRSVFAKDALSLAIWLQPLGGRLPAPLQQGLDFLAHLLAELELAELVSLHPGQALDPTRLSGDSDSQRWYLGPWATAVPDGVHHLACDYPSLDELQALSEPARLRRLGELVNTLLQAMIKAAPR